MSEKKIAPEVAQDELARIMDFYEAEPEGLTWEDNKKRLLSAIERGRIVLDENNATLTVELAAPIKLENGSTVGELTFREPNASDFKSLERYKTGEDMSKTVHLVSRITGQPIGVLDRMGARDLQMLAAVVGLFS